MVAGEDLLQEAHRAAAVPAGEWFGFREFGQRFAGCAEQEADPEPGLFGGGTQKAVVPDAG